MATGLKWNTDSLAAYKAVGNLMRGKGYRPLRQLIDKECESELTFWFARTNTVISQTFSDTGDTCYYACVTEAPEVNL